MLGRPSQYHHLRGDCGLWHRYPLEASSIATGRPPCLEDHQYHSSWGLRPVAPIPVGGKKTGEPAAPPSEHTRGGCGIEVSRFPTHHPLFQLNTHLAGAHGAYDRVRCRGAPEPAGPPGRTRGVQKSTLLLCFWVSGFKSQPKRGPPKKGKRFIWRNSGRFF